MMNSMFHKLYFFTNQGNRESIVPNIILMKHKQYTILFYPSSLISESELLHQYLTEISSQTIDYIVISSLEGLPIGFYKKLTELGLHPIIVTDVKLAKKLSSCVSDDQIYIIQDHQNIIEIGDDLILQCFPTPFVPDAGSFMVYDPLSLSLISGSLFGSFSNQFKNAMSFQAWTAFHQMYFPGSYYLKPIIIKCEQLNINTILPQFGGRIETKHVKPVLDALYQLEFFNNNQYVIQSSSEGKELNYLAFCNQILKRWKDVYGEKEVLDLFQSNDVVLDQTKIEVKSSMLKEYQVWHRLFEIAYDKKGISWLSVVEPIVKKLNSIYQIELPVIYQSVIVTAQQKMSSLDIEKDELALTVKHLQENLQSTLDRLGRCPITNEYNESFFKQFLNEHIDQEIIDHKEHSQSILFIDIDQIQLINTKYSKEAGDETLKNVAYLLNQHKSPDQLIFKRNGPGFIVFIENTTLDASMKIAEQYRNKIADSSAFIKSITISIAIVRLDEFDLVEMESNRILDLIFAKGEYRLKQASTKGGNQIINSQSKDVRVSAGKILLVDPEDIVYLMLQQTLRKENYETLWAKDGVEALEILGNMKVDFIICDRMITKVDTFSLKQQLNESNELSKIPFMLSTYHKNKELLIRTNQLEIDYIVVKPLIMEEVVGYVRRSLTGRGRV